MTPLIIPAIIFILILITLYIVLIRPKQKQKQNKQEINLDQFIKFDQKHNNVIQGNRNIQTMGRDYNLLIKDIEKNSTLPSKYKTIGDIYLNGLPEIYDNIGNVIAGIKPDLRKALYYYSKAINEGYNHAWLAIADIHHFGIPGYEGDIEKAKQIYNHLLNSDNNQLVRIAKRRLASIKAGRDPEPTRELENLVVRTRNINENTQNRNIRQNNTPNLTRRTNNTPNRIHPIPLNRNTDDIRNDLQNVHDSGISKTVEQSIDRLVQNTPIVHNTPACLFQIRKEIANRLNGQKMKNGIKALDYMEVNNSKVASLDLSEIDLLGLVWNRIHNQPNEEVRDTMKDNLMNEISECIEHNKVVCTKGRFNRIIDSLNGIDKDVELKPKWAIDKEITEKAGAMRKQLILNSDTKTKEALEAIKPTDEQTELEEEFNNKFQEELKETLTKDYIGILSETEIDNKIASWII